MAFFMSFPAHYLEGGGSNGHRTESPNFRMVLRPGHWKAFSTGVTNLTKVQIIKQLVLRNERDQLRMIVVRENVRRKWNKKVCSY